ncbi:MAG: hypothetical protein EGR19_01555 [Dialister sp.]|nr:hypothetical protein [Dialister sp.]
MSSEGSKGSIGSKGKVQRFHIFMRRTTISHFAFRISHFAFFIQSRFSNVIKGRAAPRAKETLIQSLSDFTLEFLYIARNNLTRIAGYLRKGMTELCIKILVKADSAIESAFP